MAASPAPEITVLIELGVRYDERTGTVHITAPGIPDFRTTVHADFTLRRGHPHLYAQLVAAIEAAGALQPKITARQMAIAGNVNYRSFRHALWRAKQRGELNWHRRQAKWTVTVGSPEHRDLQRIIAPLLRSGERWRVRST